ncbi:hypothetical protein HKBW3C_01926, partial [Candidatus Hakubella thermalkaliphila]
MRAGVQAGDLPIALGEGETGHLPSLSEERSQVSTDEKDQAHDDEANKEGPKEISPVRSPTPDHEER